eukprot:13567904-Ditylum_brightwellii.AAC.1
MNFVSCTVHKKQKSCMFSVYACLGVWNVCMNLLRWGELQPMSPGLLESGTRTRDVKDVNCATSLTAVMWPLSV